MTGGGSPRAGEWMIGGGSARGGEAHFGNAGLFWEVRPGCANAYFIENYTLTLPASQLSYTGQ